MRAHSPHAHLLVDDVHPSQAVEAKAVQALLAWLVNGIESGAGILLLSAVQRAGLCGFGLQVRPWTVGTDHWLKANLLLVGSRRGIGGFSVWALWKVIWAIILQIRDLILKLGLGEQQHWHADQQEDSHGHSGREVD